MERFWLKDLIWDVWRLFGLVTSDFWHAGRLHHIWHPVCATDAGRIQNAQCLNGIVVKWSIKKDQLPVGYVPQDKICHIRRRWRQVNSCISSLCIERLGHQIDSWWHRDERPRDGVVGHDVHWNKTIDSRPSLLANVSKGRSHGAVRSCPRECLAWWIEWIRRLQILWAWWIVG